MTTALCFNCGETKFGAWCPCRNCGFDSSGDFELDILFSDHRMTVTTLESFGELIKQLAEVTSDRGIRFWAFISYLSHHPSGLLSATPPDEIAAQVNQVLTDARLPIIEVELKPMPEDNLSRWQVISFPEALFHRFSTATGFSIAEAVEVRHRDGSVISGQLIAPGGSPHLRVKVDIEITPGDIVAIRSMPGCLWGWLIKPKWVE